MRTHRVNGRRNRQDEQWMNEVYSLGTNIKKLPVSTVASSESIEPPNASEIHHHKIFPMSDPIIFPWYDFAARVISCQRGSRILRQIAENAENEGNIMLLLWMVSVRIDEEMGKGAKEDKSDVVGKYKPLTVSSTRRWRNKVVVDASDLLLNNAYRQKGKE